MSDTTTTTTATASSSAPPAAPVRAAASTLAAPSWTMRRFYCWLLSAALVASLVTAILLRQPAFAWPIVSVLGLIVLAYVIGCTSTDIVNMLANSGIIRAVQSTTTAIAGVADGVSGLAGRVLAPPTTGGRSDLAS